MKSRSHISYLSLCLLSFVWYMTTIDSPCEHQMTIFISIGTKNEENSTGFVAHVLGPLCHIQWDLLGHSDKTDERIAQTDEVELTFAEHPLGAVRCFICWQVSHNAHFKLWRAWCRLCSMRDGTFPGSWYLWRDASAYWKHVWQKCVRKLTEVSRISWMSDNHGYPLSRFYRHHPWHDHWLHFETKYE